MAFQINVALKRDLLESASDSLLAAARGRPRLLMMTSVVAYWCDVGFAYDDMPPTHWDAKFEAYGGRLEGMDPVDEVSLSAPLLRGGGFADFFLSPAFRLW